MKKQKKVEHQHGDFLLLKSDEFPVGANRMEVVRGFVLERGEGVHTHVLEDIEGVEIAEKDGDIYVRVDRPTRINHEEHGVQVLKPGTYKKSVERVWDYETEEARSTID